MQAVQTGGRRNCAHKQGIANQTEKSFLLLQRAEYLRTTAFTCSVTYTRLVHYCGMSSHQTFVPHQSVMDIPEEVDVGTCQEWWRKGEAVFGGQKFQLSPNATNHITYESIGETTSTARSVNCEGGTYDKRQQLNVWIAAKIILKEEPVLLGDVLILNNPQIVLPDSCRPSAENCVTSTTTLFWTMPKGEEACKYFLNRPTTGVEVVGTEGAVTYISTDHTMIRVIKEGVRSACGDLIYATNYPKLFLTDAVHNRLFQRRLHVAEMSLVTYVNNQDGFLHGELTSEIQREFGLILAHQCRAAQARYSAAFAQRAAEHDAAIDGETTSLGSGQFATAAGEAWYTYGCRAVQVTARERKECYSALPVSLQSEHETKWRTRRGIPSAYTQEDGTVVGAIDFFMEPVTRRLVTEGVPVACSRNFAPVYRNIYEQWVKVNPGLELAPVPEQMSDKIDDDPPFANFSRQEELIAMLDETGIYTADMIREMDTFSQIPRANQGINSVIASQSTAPGGTRVLRANQLFHELPDAKAYGWMDRVLKFLDRWGKTAAIFLSLALLAKFMFWIGGAVIRVYTKYQTAGIGLAVASMFCADCMHVEPGAMEPHSREQHARNRAYNAANLAAGRDHHRAEQARIEIKAVEEEALKKTPRVPMPMATPPYPPVGVEYADLNRRLVKGHMDDESQNH